MFWGSQCFQNTQQHVMKNQLWLERVQTGCGRRMRNFGSQEWLGECVNAQVTSDSGIVASICAAAHSTNMTCARPLNVLKFLGLRLSSSKGPDGRTFSSLRPSALRGVQHVTICTFQFRRPTRYDLHVSILQELFVVHLLFSLSWNVSPGFGSEKLRWFGVRGGWPPQCRLSCFV